MPGRRGPAVQERAGRNGAVRPPRQAAAHDARGPAPQAAPGRARARRAGASRGVPSGVEASHRRAQDFSGEHRRPDGGRPVRARPFRLVVTRLGRRLRGDPDGFQGDQRRSVRDGGALAARAHQSGSLWPHGGGRGSHESRGGCGRGAESSQALRELDGCRGPRGRRRGLVRHRARGGARSVPRARDQHSGRQGFPFHAHRLGRRREGERGDRSPVLDRLGVRTLRGRAPDADPAARDRLRRDGAGSSGSRARPQPPRRLDSRAGVRPVRRPGPRSGRAETARGLFRRRTGVEPGRPDSRLSRPVGRRPVRNRVRDAFAAHVGVTVNLDMLAYDEAAHDVEGNERRPELMLGRDFERVLAALFAEELGAVIQVRTSDRGKVLERLAGLPARVIGSPNPRDELRFVRNAKPVFAAPRVELERAWSEVTFRMQQLRDEPGCAKEEFDRILDREDPGLSAVLSFDPAEDVAAPFIAARPKIAVLREQGVNGHVEMAAAFDRAGFDAVDVHMTDLIAGRASLAGFKGFAAGGGFSYGDVLGAGRGWASTILFNSRVRAEFEQFFARRDTFALGACNGCQMMAALKELIPGAEHWPAFVRNRSEQFEGRLVMVEITPSPSLLFDGMAGSRMPIVTAHGEGRAEYPGNLVQEAWVAMRYVDNRGHVTETYPYNPSGSPRGITGLTTPDGRFTIVMPHPERVFRNVQLSWSPDRSAEDSPWMRIFRNARKWVQ